MERGKLILLKLDMHKAFDPLEWDFLLAMLIKLRFGTQLVAFIVAISSSANFAVHINGRRTKPFKISRSVRQGWPLSPTLFIIAIEILNELIEQEADQGNLTGVRMEEDNIHDILRMYANDCNVILEANKENIDRCHSIFQEFGKASSLHCNWQDPKVVYIFDGPLPPELENLGWSWETSPNYSKLLGYFMSWNLA